MLPRLDNKSNFEWYEKSSFVQECRRASWKELGNVKTKSSIDNAYKTMARPGLIERYEDYSLRSWAN